jgi:hypothetical protein
MSRRQKEPLRVLIEAERQWLERIAHATQEPLSHVIRAKQLLAVAAGKGYTAAAHLTGRRSGDAVAQLVARFNREGVQAVAPWTGGGPKPVYGIAERERILAEARRVPDPEHDGTGQWSLKLLQRTLRRQEPERFKRLSTYTIWAVLRGAGFRLLRTRSWCETGRVLRRRKLGAVWVTDPDAGAKKT